LNENISESVDSAREKEELEMNLSMGVNVIGFDKPGEGEGGSSGGRFVAPQRKP
jgi:hypothetical protein